MKSFTDAFDFIKALAGVNNFTAQEKANIKTLLNRRLKVAYNSHEAWKEYTMPGEQRFFAPKVLTIEDGGSDINTLYWAGMTAGFPLYTAAKPTVEALVNVYPALYKTYSLTIDAFGNYITTPGEWRYVPQTTLSTASLNYNEPWSATLDTPLDRNNYYAQTVNLFGGIDTSPEFEEPDYSKETAYPSLASNVWYTFAGGATNTFKVKASENTLIPYKEQLSTNNPYQKNEISTYQRVHKEFPYQRKSSIEYNFHVDSGGGNVMNLIDSPESVYLTYKKTYTDLTFTDETTKVINDTFFQYACYGTYADFLRFDGQLAKAMVEEEIAKGYLDTEMEKVDIMNNSNLNFRVQTHLNTQSR
tara:strand:+ start:9323 stop:10399 length:1077 start_codon:yes stop_codon:yes gene_type:complete